MDIDHYRFDGMAASKRELLEKINRLFGLIWILNSIFLVYATPVLMFTQAPILARCITISFWAGFIFLFIGLATDNAPTDATIMKWARNRQHGWYLG
jgi:hypothetical protein